MNEIREIDEVILEAPDFADYQKAIIESPKRFTITEASTKSGKTFSHIYWLFEQAHKGESGWEYWWVAPVYSQAEIAFKRLMRKVSESGAYIVNLSKLTITTPIGTIITFKSADNPNTLYGENVHAFVFDEYSRAKEDAWFALRTTITYTKAKGKFIGNVVARNWAWDMARKAEKGIDPDFEYFKVTAYQAVDAGILSLGEIEQAKKDLPDRMFRMLYLAEFTEIEGALWTWEMIEATRVDPKDCPPLTRVVIPVDPAVTANDASDETGIIPLGKGDNGHFYVIGDYTGKYTPEDTARRIIQAYEDKSGDIVVGEVNNGGDYIETVLNLVNNAVKMPYEGVHASRGKYTRAEPIALLYSQGRIHHVGRFPLLENEMTSWAPNTGAKSPNRIDSLVWGATYLMNAKYGNDFEVN
jgi:phage terminase large subunit-like protein